MVLDQPGEGLFLRDNYGRIISYMRISVTDRCNLRCRYCMPESGIKKLEHSRILSFEDIIAIAKRPVIWA